MALYYDLPVFKVMYDLTRYFSSSCLRMLRAKGPAGFVRFVWFVVNPNSDSGLRMFPPKGPAGFVRFVWFVVNPNSEFPDSRALAAIKEEV
jgi:hypothetical protein